MIELRKWWRSHKSGFLYVVLFPACPCVTVPDPVVENGYEEALLSYFSDCSLHTDLDLREAIRGMLTEIAEEGHLTEHVMKHNTGFLLGILSLRR